MQPLKIRTILQRHILLFPLNTLMTIFLSLLMKLYYSIYFESKWNLWLQAFSYLSMKEWKSERAKERERSRYHLVILTIVLIM